MELTPQTRIEEYLKAIIEGWAEATTCPYPAAPVWRIEEFLDAFITYIWEDGGHPRHPCPEPVWRIEECLRAIYDVVTGAATPWAFPTPTNRIETCLAAIHAYLVDGTELPVPDPVWRIEEWLAGVLEAVKAGGGGTETTVTGTLPLTLANALSHAILSLTRYGLCTQDGTPTPDAPVDIVCNNGALKCSMNMANVNADTALVGYYISAQGAVTADTNNWIYQAFIPVKPNTAYTLSISTPVYYVTISEYSTAEDSGFVIRKNGSTGANTSLTVTTGENTNYIRFGTNIDRAAVTLEKVLGINWMLNEGDTAKPYAPYAEDGIYVGGTHPGQNLVDLNAVTDGYYYDQSGVYTAIPVARLTDYIFVKAGQKYTVYVKATTSGSAATVRCNLFDSAKVWKSQSNFAVTSGTANVGVVTPTEDGYLRVSANYTGTGAQVDWSVLQVVRGEYTLSTMPPYEPYTEIPYTPEVLTVSADGAETQIVTDILMLLSVGDVKDKLEFIGGHADIAITVFRVRPDMNWALASGTGYKQFYTSDTQGQLKNSVSCMSNIAPYGCTASNRASYQFGCYTGGTGNLCFQMIGEASLNTVDAWKTFLRVNGVYVVAVKATQTTEQTTAQHLVTHEETTIVDSTANVGPVVAEIKYMGAS